MSNAPRHLTLLLALLLPLGSPARTEDATDATRANVRLAFQAAMAEVSTSPFAPAGGDPEALQRYPLYPYLEAARLNRQLALLQPPTAGAATRLPLDDEIAALLTREEDRPVTRSLRSNWLQSLAARKDWARFLEHHDAGRDTQSTLRCHALVARIAVGNTDGLVDDLTSIWLTPKSLPDACDPAWEWWSARGGPGAALTERRARLALAAGESGLARHLAKSLPSARAAPLVQWAALIEAPALEIPALIANPGARSNPRRSPMAGCDMHAPTRSRPPTNFRPWCRRASSTRATRARMRCRLHSRSRGAGRRVRWSSSAP